MKKTKKYYPQKGQAIMEYMTMIALIISAFLIFERYLERGIGGRWKTAADSFDHGRGYDPQRTNTCDYDYFHTKTWYDPKCFVNKECDCSSISSTKKTCEECIAKCGCDIPENLDGLD